MKSIYIPHINADLRVAVAYNLTSELHKGENLDYISEVEVEEEAKNVGEALEKLGIRFEMFPLGGDLGDFISDLKRFNPDVAINLCEGAFGESHHEMNVPSIFELLGIPYTGSPPLSLGICQNKGLAKKILSASGILTPRYCILDDPRDWRGQIEFPLFVKPLQEDASLGISRENYVQNSEQLKERVEYICKTYRQPALVEEYICGRELNISILGNEEPIVLPISEIIFEFEEEPRIVDYRAKWVKESEEYKKTKPICPADLEAKTRMKVEKAALSAYKALYCRDYARVDMRLKNDSPIVLEVNPNPDISIEAGFARSLRAAGIPYEEFIKKIISFALERQNASRKFY
ncbi:MAG: ATP-grasp domain-containing protein [Nitrososphaerota archaeon]|nr:ATP-grasp domain-containing protein [Candidatus Bathyarchaeota archaeon]MDW8049322.1 ATP-grasp domain-containing protein [Nitrososphaerota archaeon]